MANLLAEANGDKADPNASKIIRDKAYTHMKALVEEIREAEASFSFPSVNISGASCRRMPVKHL